MFSFLRRLKNRPVRDLEQVIFDIAERQLDEDFRVLYQLMSGREVFVPADPTSFPSNALPGQKYVTTSSDAIRMSTVQGPNGWNLAVAATSRNSGVLRGGHVEMQWTDFLTMVTKLDNSIHGALLQGTTSWIAFDRQRIHHVLSNRWRQGEPT